MREDQAVNNIIRQLTSQTLETVSVKKISKKNKMEGELCDCHLETILKNYELPFHDNKFFETF